MENKEERKRVSVLVPCYNEEENVIPLSEAIIAQFEKLPQYDYEIVYIDNFSKDATRERLESLCAGNRKIKAIFNARNFGQFNSPFYGYLQTTGDCVISMCCDFQDPPEMIPKLLEKWEEGAKIVCAIKTTSKENRFVRGLRTIYYKLIKKMSDVEQIEHFTGFGLYDRSFIEVLRGLDDPAPFLRGIVAELGFRRVEIPYEQQQRRAGKTSNNFSRLYDAAMLSFTTYTKTPIRFITFFGLFLCLISVLGGIAVGVTAGIGVLQDFMPYVLLCTMVLLGGLGFFFLGIIGEYLLTVKTKVTHRPLAVEERRINFD
ncbi:MAG: glycosyltransferase family 2 protein [Christensenellaceae bacterium]